MSPATTKQTIDHTGLSSTGFITSSTKESTEFSHALPRWSLGVPFATIIVLALVWNRPLKWVLIAVVGLALVAAVLAAVHHAEVVALRVGEPFGTLILAVAVNRDRGRADRFGDADRRRNRKHRRARCRVRSGDDRLHGHRWFVPAGRRLRHRELSYRVEGTSPLLAVLAALATLTLVVPAYTTPLPGPSFSTLQLVFVGVMSLALYCVFVFAQAVRFRDYFLPVDVGDVVSHAAPPPTRVAIVSFGLLLISLVSVVGLAKSLAPSIEAAVAAAALPVPFSALPGAPRVPAPCQDCDASPGSANRDPGFRLSGTRFTLARRAASTARKTAAPNHPCRRPRTR